MQTFEQPRGGGRTLSPLRGGRELRVSRRGHARLLLSATIVACLLLLAAGRSAQAETAAASRFIVPPPGGTTVGLAETDSFAEFFSGLPFEASSVTAFDEDTQQFVTYEAGDAWSSLHTRVFIADFTPDTPVWVTRKGAGSGQDRVALPFIPRVPDASGVKTVTIGAIGATSLRDFVRAQPFPVASVMAFDVGTQRYLVYLPGAPAFASTLAPDSPLAPDTVVVTQRARAAAAAPTPPPPSGGSRVPPRPPSAACQPVSQARLALLKERLGYGQDASGGAGGCLYRVTNLDDSGPGSLREGAERGGQWIVFDVVGPIVLKTSIDVAANTTIDGRGASITLQGRGLYVVDTPNVVISHLRLRDIRGGGQDAIQLRGRLARDIWVHHVTIYDVADGYIDVTQGATDITVSWSRFEPSSGGRDKTMVVGAGGRGDRDDLTFVTLHHNVFDGTQQRSPLIRGAMVHSFNNYFIDWGIYGSGVDGGGRLFSERNVYDSERFHRGRAYTPWGAGPAYIRSTGDLFLGGASGVVSSPGEVSSPSYSYLAEPPTSLPPLLATRAGFRYVGLVD